MKLLNIVLFVTIVALTAGVTYLIDYNNRKPPVTEISKDTGDTALTQQVPAFSFTDRNGETHSIEDFRGKIVLLNFWASWCPPCIREFPYFIKAADEYKDDLVIIALSSDIEEAAMNRFLTKLEKEQQGAFPAPNMLVALDENTAITGDIFQTFKLPETILIDRQGQMREKLIGADWKYEDLTQKIEALQ